MIKNKIIELDSCLRRNDKEEIPSGSQRKEAGVERYSDSEGIFVPEALNLKQTFRDLLVKKAISVKILRDDFREFLLVRARDMNYIGVDDVAVSKYNQVEQRFTKCEKIEPTSPFALLKVAFQDVLNLQGEKFFDRPMIFNDMLLMRYDPGSVGISAHRDSPYYVNLVCIFTIGGKGKFFVCDDKYGTNKTEIDSSPGTVILMRAPGFGGLKDQPYHLVSDILETRYSFGLRHKIKAP